jgi:hypothetical protein
MARAFKCHEQPSFSPAEATAQFGTRYVMPAQMAAHCLLAGRPPPGARPAQCKLLRLLRSYQTARTASHVPPLDWKLSVS